MMFKVNQIKIKNDPESLPITVLFVGDTESILYSRFTCKRIKNTETDSKYETYNRVNVPFHLVEIRRNEDLDNTFFKTDSGAYLRTNIKNFAGGFSFEEITHYAPQHKGPNYAAIEKWFNESEIVKV